MKIKVQKGSVLANEPVDVDGITWLVVYDHFDQPITVIEQVGSDTVFVATCSDEKFPAMLQRLGLGKPPVVSEIRT